MARSKEASGSLVVEAILHAIFYVAADGPEAGAGGPKHPA